MHLARTSAAIAIATILIAAVPGIAAVRQQRGVAPHVIYSTLLGGTNGDFDNANDIAVDPSGNALVCGLTESDDFPVSHALQPTMKGSSDAFVTKLGPTGSLVFSTFLGGSESESAQAIATDSSGAIYVGGTTSSTDFPVRNGFQMTKGTFSDGFVAKLAPDGQSIIWATFLGGSGADDVEEIAVDPDGRVIVAGRVGAISGVPTFPTVNAVQPSYGGGTDDAFVSIISADGGDLLASTLLDMRMQTGVGEPGTDRISTLRVVPGTSDIFFAGSAETDEGEDDLGYIARLGVPGSKAQDPHVFIELLFGAYPQIRHALAHPEERGWKLTRGMLLRYPDAIHDTPQRGIPADDIPMLAEGLCHPGGNGTCDDIVSLVHYSKGLDEREFANLPVLNEFFLDAAAADLQNAVYIAGDLFNDRLATVNPIQAAYGGNDDVVIAVLAPGTLEKVMVSFFGGDGYVLPTSIVTDADGNVYIAGLTTLSTTFPTTPGAVQTVPKGRNDGFVVKISPFGFAEAPDYSLSFAEPNVTVARGAKITATLDVARVGGFGGKVTVSPPAAVDGFKLPKTVGTKGSSVALKIKVKPTAPLGPTSFTFTGTDKMGRARSATITVTVE